MKKRHELEQDTEQHTQKKKQIEGKRAKETEKVINRKNIENTNEKWEKTRQKYKDTGEKRGKETQRKKVINKEKYEKQMKSGKKIGRLSLEVHKEKRRKILLENIV